MVPRLGKYALCPHTPGPLPKMPSLPGKPYHILPFKAFPTRIPCLHSPEEPQTFPGFIRATLAHPSFPGELLSLCPSGSLPCSLKTWLWPPPAPCHWPTASLLALLHAKLTTSFPNVFPVSWGFFGGGALHCNIPARHTANRRILLTSPRERGAQVSLLPVK